MRQFRSKLESEHNIQASEIQRMISLNKDSWEPFIKNVTNMAIDKQNWNRYTFINKFCLVMLDVCKLVITRGSKLADYAYMNRPESKKLMKDTIEKAISEELTSNYQATRHRIR